MTQPDPRLNTLLARMTLSEKVAQLGSIFIYDLLDEKGFSEQKAQRIAGGVGQITRLGGYSLLTPRQRAETANAVQRYLVNHTRLGIPAIIHEECCSGFTALEGTNFPQMIGLASTFRPELARQMASAIRKQMRSVGAHQGLAPVLDLYRDPRWGRVEETFGEDPALTARFGAAYIRGLQGETLSDGVMATGKHFIAHSLSEGGLNCTPVHLGPREIRESYLLPYEAAVNEAHVACMMNSYSELDGSVVAADPKILRGLLREELGFDGLVVSDYLAIDMLHNHHRVATDRLEAAVKAMIAGIDLELPETSCFGDTLLQAVSCGIVDEALVNEAVLRVLAKKFELGLFENPYVDVPAVDAVYADPAPRALAREIAAQSLVLLKNDNNVLPLSSKIRTLAVIGPNAAAPRHYLSDYSYASMVDILLDGNPHLRPVLQASGSQAAHDAALRRIPTILDALSAALPAGTRVIYAQGCPVLAPDRSGFAEAEAAAREADAVVLVLGDRSGLSLGCTTGEFNDRADLSLPGVQLELVDVVDQAAAGKPVAAVLVNGRPLELTGLVERVPAVLECWIPGEQGALAVADALVGLVNPGGRLPVSLPRSVGQLPLVYNRKPSGGRSHFRGDYIDESVLPLFAFGHGLSYTQFNYANLSVSPQLAAGSVVHVTCEVTNTGSCPGDEVVQLYIQDEYACMPRPQIELKGFCRVTLQPGQTAQVAFELTPAHLAYYNEEMALCLEPGLIHVMVGSSSSDLRLRGDFMVTALLSPARRSTQIEGSCIYREELNATLP